MVKDEASMHLMLSVAGHLKALPTSFTTSHQVVMHTVNPPFRHPKGCGGLAD